MNILGRFHSDFIHSGRVIRLAELCGDLLPESGKILEVGCGDGKISKLMAERRPGAQLSGIEVMPREGAEIPVTKFDGITIPFEDNYFDSVCFIDVLHHTADPLILLREAARVSCGSIVLKDHQLKGLGALQILRLMDWVGNSRYGVSLPYNYWTIKQWKEAFAELNLKPEVWTENLNLYPFYLRPIFERSLHCVIKLIV